ncbi:MAG: DUF5132 domain-containing protein [Prochloraceae cyanobacterium]|nr:DUF5132 domain-containing protein [Prochloraceae cyanobacterium]
MLEGNQPRENVLNKLQRIYQDNPTRTIAIGLGVVVCAPIVLPLLKPVAKATIKGGVNLYEKTKGAIAEAGEVIGDIVAEAKAEAAAERAEKARLSAGLLAPQTHSQGDNTPKS